ncbi:MAG: LysM peptidoglycan-binding domain-containing protein, partial [Caldilineaceae bacterium]|nr:LysM peptidoglycan-binding domain-containing protein [Caldilineaceae bacterium]
MTMQIKPFVSLKTLFLTLGFVLLLALGLTLAGAGSVQAQGRSGYEYTVQPGDSWPALARMVGLSVADLQSANPQAVRPNGWVTIGEKIFVPTAPDAQGVIHVVQYAESWGSISLQYGVKVRLLQGANPKLMRANQVLYREEQVFVPPAANMAGLTQAGQPAPPPAPPTPPARLPPVSPPPTPPPEGGAGLGPAAPPN